jgi:hypothetical protein
MVTLLWGEKKDTKYEIVYNNNSNNITQQHNSRAAGSFYPTFYTPDDGKLGRNM